MEENASARQKLEMKHICFQWEVELLKQQVQKLNVKNENLVTQSNAMKQKFWQLQQNYHKMNMTSNGDK